MLYYLIVILINKITVVLSGSHEDNLFGRVPSMVIFNVSYFLVFIEYELYSHFWQGNTAILLVGYFFLV